MAEHTPLDPGGTPPVSEPGLADPPAAVGEELGAGPRGGLGAIAVGALIVLAVLLATLLVSGNGQHGYTLTFDNGGGLVKGNQVQIGGYPVGTIDDIYLTDDGLAAVEISVSQQLHEGTTAVIRTTSLAGVANRYVSISPGANSEPPLEGGATLGLESTTAAVEFDQLFNAFRPRARRGLARFFRGQGAVYAGKGPEANETYEYFEPGLDQWTRVLDELNADQRMFERFVTSSARLFTAVAERGEDLSSSITSGGTAFDAIASENRALDQTLQRLGPTFRQSNTTFVNLRAALDDLDPLVATAKPATRDLGSFMRRLRPVISGAVPLFRDLRLAFDRPGRANDLGYLIPVMPKIARRAGPSFRHARQAIADFQPTLDFARPYAPEMVHSLAKLGQASGYYDANGHYFRAGVSNLNLFDWDPDTQRLEPLAMEDQYEPLGPFDNLRRCPGGATQSAPDGSNPFVDPPWPLSGIDSGDCDPAALPPGP